MPRKEIRAVSQGPIVVTSIAAILVIANLLILGHELGHYTAARTAGIAVRHFTIGFGPTLARWCDRSGTIWTIGMLPLGGFVGFAGESDPTPKESYAGRHPATPLVVIAAGPAANVVIAIGIYAGIAAVQGQTTVLPVVSSIVADSAAARAGFQPADRILAVSGQPVATFDELRPILQQHPGAELSFRVERHDEVVNLLARIGSKREGGREVGYLGIWSTEVSHRPLSVRGVALTALQDTWQVVADTGAGIGRLVSTGQGADNFAGVLEVAHLAGQAAVAGGASLVILTAVLSVNLALMNLLPIPVLDGGALLFCAVEWIRGRPAPPRVLDFATRSGAALIAMLFIASTLHDLAGFGVFRWLGLL
jgi:regulator of sigma E protease